MNDDPILTPREVDDAERIGGAVGFLGAVVLIFVTVDMAVFMMLITALVVSFMFVLIVGGAHLVGRFIGLVVARKLKKDGSLKK